MERMMNDQPICSGHVCLRGLALPPIHHPSSSLSMTVLLILFPFNIVEKVLIIFLWHNKVMEFNIYLLNNISLAANLFIRYNVLLRSNLDL